MFFKGGVMQTCGKFAAEYPFRKVILVKLHNNFCINSVNCLVNLLQIYRAPFSKMVSGGLLLWLQCFSFIYEFYCKNSYLSSLKFLHLEFFCKTLTRYFSAFLNDSKDGSFISPNDSRYCSGSLLSAAAFVPTFLVTSQPVTTWDFKITLQSWIPRTTPNLWTGIWYMYWLASNSKFNPEIFDVWVDEVMYTI